MGTWSGSREEAIEYLQWWAHPELDSSRSPITVEHVAVREVLAELTQLQNENAELRHENAELRARVTTGGPAPRFTDQWENGASSRPPTAPPEEISVALPVSEEELLHRISAAIDHLTGKYEPPTERKRY